MERGTSLPYRYVVVLLLMGVAATWPSASCRALEARPATSVSLYGARWSDNYFGELATFQTEWRDSYLWVIAVSRKLGAPNRALSFEGEANVGRHTGLGDHLEFNLAVLGRWHPFPWDAYLRSTGAFGLGYSYATRRPRVEVIGGDDAERSLMFMVLEITAAPPGRTRWETFLRIHHRSDAYDLLGDGRGSNFLGAGVRYFPTGF